MSILLLPLAPLSFTRISSVVGRRVNILSAFGVLFMNTHDEVAEEE